MKRFNKIFLLLSIFVLVMGLLYSTGWTEEVWSQDDPIRQEWNVLDLVVARPLGVAAAIGGAGVFIVSLPFTVSVDIISNMKGSRTQAVNEAAKMLMLKPLKFSFVREFPDEDI
jgi:hypothetical protein